MLHIDLIPHDVKNIAKEVADFTTKVEAALKSNTALEIEALIGTLVPGVEADRQALIAICDTAIASCKSIQAADWSGVEGILQRLGSDLTAGLHGKLHGISAYIQWFEVVFNHFFGGTKVTPAL